MRVLFVFVDGVGLGDDDAAVNPVAAASLPVLTGLLGGRRPTRSAAPHVGAGATLVGLDATLGVAGLPQSGTGQASLLTGENAAARLGRHLGPWTPTALRPLLAERSVLARARSAGLDVAFANAYPEELLERLRETGGVPRGATPLRAGPPLAALGAGLLTRHTAALAEGRAVASEITNDGWIQRLGRTGLPTPTPHEAGATLAVIAASHDLTLFAHYATDHAGHRGGYDACVAAMERLDAFLGGILEALPADALLVVASDHGNLEDARGGHTRNPALGLVAGPGHEAATGLASLTDVTPMVLAVLGVAPPA